MAGRVSRRGGRRPGDLRGAALALGLVTALAGAACDAPDPRGGGDTLAAPAAEGPGVAVFDPFVPAPAGGAGAFYARLVDTDGRGDRLEGAASDAAGRTMLHVTRHHEGRTSMRPAEGGIAVPASGEVRLAPGGPHVMLMDLAGPLLEGDSVELELRFERAGALTVRAPVISYAEAARRTEGDE